MDAKEQKLSLLTIKQSLMALDGIPDSRGFVDLALGHSLELDLDLQLLLIFHGWQCGALDLIQYYAMAEKMILPHFSEIFLKAHLLRQQGKKAESIELIRELSKECDHEIVRYRAYADSLEQGKLEDVINNLSKTLNDYSGWRHAVMTFNLGVATLNKSQFNTSKLMLALLEEKDDLLHNYFSHWLKGQIESHKGKHVEALHQLMRALEYLNQLKARRGDQFIILANCISECLWIGLPSEGKQFLTDLTGSHHLGTGPLSNLRIAAAEAQIVASQGSISEAYKRMSPHFAMGSFSRDHLMIGFFYLWLLVFLEKGEEISFVVKRLEVVRDHLGQSADYFDFEIFKIYGQFLETPLAGGAEDKILKHHGNLLHRAESFHLSWSKAILSLVYHEPHLKLNAMGELHESPWILKCLIVKFSKDKNIKNPNFWRFWTSYGNDRIVQLLARLKLHQDYQDIEFLLPDIKELSQLGCWGWLEEFHDEGGWIKSRLLKEVPSSDLVFDTYSKKILNPKTNDILQPLSQVGALLNYLLGAGKRGVTKENISKLLGNTVYDPISHDPAIYTLISRSRHWLSTQNIDLDILNRSGAWYLNGSAKIILFKPNEDFRIVVAPKSDIPAMQGKHFLNLRQTWIYEQLLKNGLVTRAEVLRVFSVKKSTVVNDFNFLISKGLVTRMGNGRSTYYLLTGVKNEAV